MLKSHLLIAIFCLVPLSLAVGQTQEQKLVFPPGKTATTVKGVIRGQEDRRYTLAVGEGQVLQILFSASNGSCYFNAYSPESADSAVHIGSSRGNEFGASPARPGGWRFDVYLMRNAARRTELCRFTLSVELTGKPGGASVGVPDIVLRDQCLANAVPMYRVSKRALTLGAIETGQDGVVIDGTVDKGREGIKKLRCRFTAERRFIDVMAMTPDGE